MSDLSPRLPNEPNPEGYTTNVYDIIDRQPVPKRGHDRMVMRQEGTEPHPELGSMALHLAAEDDEPVPEDPLPPRYSDYDDSNVYHLELRSNLVTKEVEEDAPKQPDLRLLRLRPAVLGTRLRAVGPDERAPNRERLRLVARNVVQRTVKQISTLRTKASS